MRKLSRMLLLMLFAFLLAACGGEDDEPEPTVAATEPPVATEAAEAEPTVDEIAMVEASPDASPMAESSPTSAVVPIDAATGATPDAVGTPVALASPVGEMATPELAASPGATPAGASVVSPASLMETDVDEEEPAVMVPLSGQVVLAGAENQAYVISDDGCVGLGEHSDMQAGRQVVVRDESARIVGVTTLEASDDEGCAWAFDLDVPESEFYSVAVPMKTEMVFTQQEVAEGNGDLAVPLP